VWRILSMLYCDRGSRKRKCIAASITPAEDARREPSQHRAEISTLVSIQRERIWTNYLYRHQCKMLSAKNLPVKGLCGRCLYVFKNRMEIQSVVFVFSGPALRNVTPLTFSLVSFPPPPFPVWICILYTVHVYSVWGVMGSWEGVSDR
jgi:hypothetical protein